MKGYDSNTSSGDSPAQERLLDAVLAVYLRHRDEVEKVKESARKTGEEPDSLWEGLVRSMATWGNARGIRLLEEAELHKLLRWDALTELSESELQDRFLSALRAANVRYPEKKASYLLRNFRLVKGMGGTRKAKERLTSIPDKDGIMKFLQEFSGIGPKYARNIMMDGYDPAFRNSIAIDLRIQKILKAVGKPFSGRADYDRAERFLAAVAGQAGIEGWDLDRLMFLYNAEILSHLVDATPDGPS